MKSYRVHTSSAPPTRSPALRLVTNTPDRLVFRYAERGGAAVLAGLGLAIVVVGWFLTDGLLFEMLGDGGWFPITAFSIPVLGLLGIGTWLLLWRERLEIDRTSGRYVRSRGLVGRSHRTRGRIDASARLTVRCHRPRSQNSNSWFEIALHLGSAPPVVLASTPYIAQLLAQLEQLTSVLDVTVDDEAGITGATDRSAEPATPATTDRAESSQ